MYRKISHYIEDYLTTDYNYILCIDGARQIGKTYIINELAKKHYKYYVEINMANDKINQKLFENVNSLESFYLALSSIAGDKLKNKKETIIFIDEIQVYPELFTLLKPLNLDNRFKYICSGSELGIEIQKSTLIPMGSIMEKKMYPMDFEEFLIANSVGEEAISHLKKCYENKETPNQSVGKRIQDLFKLYLLIGGMPAAVNEYLESKNIVKVREIQKEIIKQYANDAAKYDKENSLKIKRIYDMVPSNIENKVKRIKFSEIDKKDNKNRYSNYLNEFDYLLSSGIVLGAKAISEPKFPLIQSSSKSLIKLYMNDVGLLTSILYKNNIQAVFNDMSGVNLGAVYETVVAQELKAHDHELYYYDRKNVGEVDYLIDDYDNLSVLPLEIKSGKDYHNFRAIPKIVNDKNYRISNGYILNNEIAVSKEDKLIYMPIFNIMFI